MSINIKIVLLVVLGVAACILITWLNTLFMARSEHRAETQSLIEQALFHVHNIRLCEETFIKEGDENSWNKIQNNLKLTRDHLKMAKKLAPAWKKKINDLKKVVDKYEQDLDTMHSVVLELNIRRPVFLQMGKAFCEEMEKKIIMPYQEEASLLTFNGKGLDPFKARAKDLAYAMVNLQIKEQLLLEELFLNQDLEIYHQEKRRLTKSLTLHKGHLISIAILLGNEKKIQSVVAKLESKLKRFLDEEKRLVYLFERRQELTESFNETSQKMFGQAGILFEEMELEYKKKKRLSRILNWGLVLGVVFSLCVLGFIIVRNTIMVVEQRRQAEKKYRSIFENSIEGIFQVTVDDRILSANPAFARVFGYDSPKQMISDITNFTQQLYVAPARQKDLIRLLEDGPVLGFEAQFYRKDRSKILALLNAYYVYGENGQLLYIEGSFEDISERRKAEEERKKLEVRLQHAQRMETLGTLAGGIAHDFNNLLMGIQGNVSLMLLDIDSSHSIYKKSKNIEEYVQKAANLTKQLLGFSRGGKYEVKPIDLNDLVKKSSEMFGRTKKEIKIYRKYQDKIWIVEVDSGQIEQVLLNLYINAWQAMQEGGKLHLQTENIIFDENYVKPYYVKPGRYVKLSVTDSGIGMNEKTCQRIFDPFFTTKELGRGTGLGLASAYGIVKNHNGVINVYSEKGKGTTFNIYLPASEKGVAENKELLEEVHKGQGTILFVDDEDMIIYVGKRMLEKMGYKHIIAKSGKEAIDIYKANKDKIDMVIMDMVMPDMGGSKVYNKIKEINPDAKVLLSSGYSINGEATKILERGCNGFIQKPFGMKQLSRKIREILY